MPRRPKAKLPLTKTKGRDIARAGNMVGRVPADLDEAARNFYEYYKDGRNPLPVIGDSITASDVLGPLNSEDDGEGESVLEDEELPEAEFGRTKPRKS
jgi:hypothetical protein